MRPTHLALWSFMMATAHGAGLMLVPVVLGLCGDGAVAHAHHRAVREPSPAATSASRSTRSPCTRRR
ncbi:MAG: hypothetical protein MZV65_18730 [Chromatiales bacterium]|nr:hypothetical protein [Chromatiales bacterium]